MSLFSATLNFCFIIVIDYIYAYLDIYTIENTLFSETLIFNTSAKARKKTRLLWGRKFLKQILLIYLG